jgi:hypothetical protein
MTNLDLCIDGLLDSSEHPFNPGAAHGLDRWLGNRRRFGVRCCLRRTGLNEGLFSVQFPQRRAAGIAVDPEWE